jgi:hypothetical protein
MNQAIFETIWGEPDEDREVNQFWPPWGAPENGKAPVSGRKQGTLARV